MNADLLTSCICERCFTTKVASRTNCAVCSVRFCHDCNSIHENAELEQTESSSLRFCGDLSHAVLRTIRTKLCTADITCLDLAWCTVGIGSLALFDTSSSVDSVQFRSLLSCNMDGLPIGDFGFLRLLDASPCLVTLSVAATGLTDAAITTLVSAVASRVLCRVNLSSNGITDKALHVLKTWRAPSLFSLSLVDNPISRKASIAFAEHVFTFPSVGFSSLCLLNLPLLRTSDVSSFADAARKRFLRLTCRVPHHTPPSANVNQNASLAPFPPRCPSRVHLPPTTWPHDSSDLCKGSPRFRRSAVYTHGHGSRGTNSMRRISSGRVGAPHLLTALRHNVDGGRVTERPVPVSTCTTFDRVALREEVAALMSRNDFPSPTCEDESVGGGSAGILNRSYSNKFGSSSGRSSSSKSCVS